jgi:tol-pal system protein YbgF
VQQVTEIDGRLLRIERILSNQSLLEQAQRLDTLYNELRALRGQVEQLQHSVDTARTQQRELYADLDKRLQAVESRAATVPVAGAATSGGGDDDATAYRKAFDLLKEGKYTDSATAFSRFLAAYPQSNLTDNVYYWRGEAHYAAKDFAAALASFQAVTDKFPESRKLQDAWLKVGYCQYELKNWQVSRDALKRAQQLGADTATGKLAEQRLAKLQAEGH